MLPTRLPVLRTLLPPQHVLERDLHQSNGLEILEGIPGQVRRHSAFYKATILFLHHSLLQFPSQPLKKVFSLSCNVLFWKIAHKFSAVEIMRNRPHTINGNWTSSSHSQVTKGKPEIVVIGRIKEKEVDSEQCVIDDESKEEKRVICFDEEKEEKDDFEQQEENSEKQKERRGETHSKEEKEGETETLFERRGRVSSWLYANRPDEKENEFKQGIEQNVHNAFLILDNVC